MTKRTKGARKALLSDLDREKLKEPILDKRYKYMLKRRMSEFFKNLAIDLKVIKGSRHFDGFFMVHHYNLYPVVQQLSVIPEPQEPKDYMFKLEVKRENNKIYVKRRHLNTKEMEEFDPKYVEGLILSTSLSHEEKKKFNPKYVTDAYPIVGLPKRLRKRIMDYLDMDDRAFYNRIPYDAWVEFDKVCPKLRTTRSDYHKVGSSTLG